MKKNNKGAALVSVILVLVVSSILAIALLNLALGNTRQTVVFKKDMQAHYLARSGVNMGVALLDARLTDQSITDIGTMLTTMSAYISALPAGSFAIESVGSYTIAYEAVNATAVRIISTGTTAETPPRSNTVSMTIQLTIPATTIENPSDWVSGNNLNNGIDTSKHYKGKGVTFKAKPIQAPQGSPKFSVFQTSAILFTDSDGYSLLQINNCASITFDAEVLYFQSGVMLNSKATTATQNKVIFRISDEILGQWTSSGRLLTAISPKVGFESAARYDEFVDGLTFPGYVNYGGTTFDTTYTGFISGTHYGLVRFGGDVLEPITSKTYKTQVSTDTYQYYFYADGTELKDIKINQLIPIRNDDILIKAIESLFKYTITSDGSRLWSEE
ncbi:MAG: hypothetical protein ACYCYM_11030 [Saccharofermentanales bacterium]